MVTNCPAVYRCSYYSIVSRICQKKSSPVRGAFFCLDIYAEELFGDDADEEGDDGYADADQVGEFARDAMAWANGAGLINGTIDNRLNPVGTATRAQAAVMLYNLMAR